MSKSRISTTEAARNLGEYLARIRYTGARFILVKNRKDVAELGPVPGASAGTFAELWDAMRSTAADEGFVDDLIRVNDADVPMDNPWRSSGPRR
ncbi:MAG: hypothetical protein ACLFPO_13430 [Spirochaetaceae bacterium]